ncbi:ACT domain-containing protein ACR8, partial [Striga hermonthica]
IDLSLERRCRHLTVDALWRVCFQAEEIALHVVRDCPMAAAIWRRLLSGEYHATFFAWQLEPWIFSNLAPNSGIGEANWDRTFEVVVWKLWKWRNEQLFHGKIRDVVSDMREITTYVKGLKTVLLCDMKLGGSGHLRIPRWIRVIIDNGSDSNETRLMIDSARKHGILLEAVQVLTDLNLSIKKAYICSDGRWFMDVFHVTDFNGNKLTDDSVLGRIQQSLETVHYGRPTRANGLTALEITGTDRVGLLSEVFAVLTDMDCNVVEAKVWAHNGRVASLIFVKDCHTGCPIKDEDKLDKIGSVLRNVLKGDDETTRSVKTSVSSAVTHTERRLHQLMFADRDYDTGASGGPGSCPGVSVRNYLEKDYSVVSVQCQDQNKLLFDVVCALTDMDYVVFHATVDTSEDSASMEFFIRHTDGTPISSEAEKEHVILCLQASMERRSSKGVRLDLCAADRNGLLADVTQAFRENGLSVARAEISTTWDTARNVFYVTDAVGNTVDPEIVELVREKVGFGDLKVTETPSECSWKVEREGPRMGTGDAILLSIGSMVRKNLNYLGLIKS